MHEHDEFNEQIHPKDLPAEPDHPMTLDGGVVPGDVGLMITCMVEELLLLGTPIEKIREMSADPEFQALYAARYSLGDQAIDELINDAGRRVGIHHHRDHEHTGDIQSVTLTVRGQAK